MWRSGPWQFERREDLLEEVREEVMRIPGEEQHPWQGEQQMQKPRG